MKSKEGFTNDNEIIKGFTATCSICGSNNISLEVEIATGYDINHYGGRMDITCRDCKVTYEKLF